VSRALVVDDNQELAANVAELLEILDLDVVVAHDAKSALARVTEAPVDVAIVDVGLPFGASGVELVPTLRLLSPQIQIIIVTGNATVDSAVAAVRQGIFAYVQKPFDSGDLLAIVSRALAQTDDRRERERLASELARSEALHRSLVETIDAAILILDRKGIIRFANRFAVERQGHAPALEGESFVDIFIEEEARGRFVRALDELHRDGTPSTIESNVRGPRGARTFRWSLSSSDGTDTGPFLAVGIDLTEIRDLQRRTVEAEALAAVGTLTSGLAHEIRNPLNAASLQLELLVRSALKVEDAAQRERMVSRVTIVRTELSRLERMLNDFLSLARPSSLRLRDHDLHVLVHEVLELQRPLAESMGVTIDVSIADDAAEVRVDEARIKQVLINLVTNALEALRPFGEGHVSIDARVEDDAFVAVRVIDDGPGIPTTEDDAFRPFVTTKEGGTGLGLAIVRTIVQRHGGEVHLRDAVPRGTIARFTVPRGARPDDARS
jgi:PAS domain S-box-containing protein